MNLNPGHTNDYQLTPGQQKQMDELAPAAGSEGHVRMPIVTPKGNHATITGDPSMNEKTRAALGEMIDAAIKAANDGTLKPLNC